jgi:hypothetical protein
MAELFRVTRAGLARDDRGGVIEKRLTFQDRHNATWQPGAAGDRTCRDRVRRCDDGAERYCRGEGDRQLEMRDERQIRAGEPDQCQRTLSA